MKMTEFGGDCSEVQDQLTDVQHIYSTNRAFAALKLDGSVVAWGAGPSTFEGDHGGDCSAIQAQLAEGVQHISSTERAFATLKAGGSVASWGDEEWGGDCSQIQEQLARDVQHIYATNSAFAALKGDGSVVAWGNSCCGGDSQKVQAQLLDVQHSMPFQPLLLHTRLMVVWWHGANIPSRS